MIPFPLVAVGVVILIIVIVQVLRKYTRSGINLSLDHVAPELPRARTEDTGNTRPTNRLRSLSDKVKRWSRDNWKTISLTAIGLTLIHWTIWWNWSDFWLEWWSQSGFLFFQIASGVGFFIFADKKN